MIQEEAKLQIFEEEECTDSHDITIQELRENL